jgi:DNA-binding MarR family transcriptional regulator
MTPRIIYLIKRAEIEVTARMSNALEASGLTPIQFSLLYFIDVNKGDLSSAQLSRRFSVTPQSMNELVQVLQRKRLIKKNVDPSHRRILRISLTRKGRQLLEDSNHELDTLEEHLLKDLSEEEITILRSLLGKILESARKTVTGDR